MDVLLLCMLAAICKLNHKKSTRTSQLEDLLFVIDFSGSSQKRLATGSFFDALLLASFGDVYTLQIISCVCIRICIYQ